MYEDLYEQNKAMLWANARRFRGYCEKDRAVSVEDLVQSGFIGLVEAAKTFDPESGRPWPFHAKWYVIREIYKALGLRGDGEYSRADPGAVSLDNHLTEGDADSATLGDLLADESLPASDEALLQDELRTSVRDAVAQLTDPRQRRIAELYMIQGQSLAEVADDVGISTAKVLQLYGRALANLARDIRLQALADLDDRTRFYKKKGIRSFNADRTSVTEEQALWRIEQREKIERRLAWRGRKPGEDRQRDDP